MSAGNAPAPAAAPATGITAPARDTPELWLPVVGYEGFYEVSSHGQVRSRDRVVPTSGGGLRFAAGRILAQTMRSRSQRSYPAVCLYRDGKQRMHHVHSLVLAAHVGPRPEGMVACHFDDNPLNNRADNLRWGSRSANALDMVRNGNHPNARKTVCPQGHPYSAENTIVTLKANGTPTRLCRICARGRWRKQRRRQRAIAVISRW